MQCVFKYSVRVIFEHPRAQKIAGRPVVDKGKKGVECVDGGINVLRVIYEETVEIVLVIVFVWERLHPCASIIRFCKLLCKSAQGGHPYADY